MSLLLLFQEVDIDVPQGGVYGPLRAVAARRQRTAARRPRGAQAPTKKRVARAVTMGDPKSNG